MAMRSHARTESTLSTYSLVGAHVPHLRLLSKTLHADDAKIIFEAHVMTKTAAYFQDTAVFDATLPSSSSPAGGPAVQPVLALNPNTAEAQLHRWLRYAAGRTVAQAALNHAQFETLRVQKPGPFDVSKGNVNTTTVRLGANKDLRPKRLNVLHALVKLFTAGTRAGCLSTLPGWGVRVFRMLFCSSHGLFCSSQR